LGAGFAGLTLAEELEPIAATARAVVTLVERNAHFTMGFNMQWAMVGRRRPEEGMRPYQALRARHVHFLHDEVIAIDTDNQTVYTRSQRLPYQHLVIALGAELAPETFPGLVEGAYNLCDIASVLQLRSALEHVAEGTVLVAVTAVPFKCPPAPYEYAMLIDEMLRSRGVREHVQVVVTTPEPQPMPLGGPTVGEAMKALLSARGIEFVPSQTPRKIDPVRRTVVYDDGRERSYTVLAAMPPHRAPGVVRSTRLATAGGFVPVDLQTFRSTVPNVYAVGDVAALSLPNGKPHPKAGVFAEAQARTVARQLIAQLEGQAPPPYEGKGACYIDTGQNQAVAAEAYLLEPGGPRFALAAPSAAGLESKARWEQEHLTRWFGG